MDNDNGSSTLYRQLKPGPGLPPKQVSAHQRARILGAMVELAFERPYERVTVADLARAAGVSKASFYAQFSSKEDCFMATFDTVTHEAILFAGKLRIEAGL